MACNIICGSDQKIRVYHIASDCAVQDDLGTFSLTCGSSSTSHCRDLCASSSADGSYLALFGESQFLQFQLHKRAGLPSVTTIDEDREDLVCCTSLPDHRWAMFGCRSGVIITYDLITKAKTHRMRCEETAVQCVTIAQNKRHLLAGSASGKIHVIGLATRQHSAQMVIAENDAKSINAIRCNPLSESQVGSVSDDGSLRLWDSCTQKQQHSFCEHELSATALVFSAVVDKFAMSVGLDARIVCYDIRDRKPIKTITSSTPIHCVDLCTDGRRAAVGNALGQVAIYDLRRSTKPVNTFLTNESGCPVYRLLFHGARANVTGPEPIETVKKTTVYRNLVGRGGVDTIGDHTESIETPEPSLQPRRLISDSSLDSVFSPIASNVSSRMSMRASEFGSQWRGANSSLSVERPCKLIDEHGVFSPLNKCMSDGHVLVQQQQPEKFDSAATAPSTHPCSRRIELNEPCATNGHGEMHEKPERVAQRTNEPNETRVLGQTVPLTPVANPSHTNVEPEQHNHAGVSMSNQSSPGPVQVEIIRSVMQDALDDFEDHLHADLVHLQCSLLLELQLQEERIAQHVVRLSANESLERQNAILRKENELLRQRCGDSFR